jgi:catechol 2,3-dioxygenase-like lactoylglutathione lyase family enzyme
MLDHISLATDDMAATRSFYEEKLGFPILIHETIDLKEGGVVDHQFFDCGEGCAIAFMQWREVDPLPRLLRPWSASAVSLKKRALMLVRLSI